MATKRFNWNIFKIPKGLGIIVAVGAILIIVTLLAFLLLRIIATTADLTGLKEPVIGNCTDTDGGKIDNSFGTCADNTRKTYSDTCVFTGVRETLKLQEYFCETNTCKSETIACQEGFSCIGGQCAKS